jgi:hypothetical protein
MPATAMLLEAYSSLPFFTANHRIQYGDDSSQFGDLFLPSQPIEQASRHSYPVVILLHGGCWRAQHGLEPLGQFARALTERGLAVWNLEYRRCGSGISMWPDTFLDTAHGADKLRDLAGPFKLDLDRVVAMGRRVATLPCGWLGDRISRPPVQYTPPRILYKLTVLWPLLQFVIQKIPFCGRFSKTSLWER